MLVGKLQLVGGVDLGIELERFGRRAFQAQWLGKRAARLGGLRLQRTGQGFRVVLQRNDPLHGAAGRIDQDQAAAQQTGGEWAAHLLNLTRTS